MSFYKKISCLIFLSPIISTSLSGMESVVVGGLNQEAPSLVDVIKVAELSYSGRKTVDIEHVNQDIRNMGLIGYKCLAYEAPHTEKDVSGLYSLAVFHPKKRLCILGFRGTESNNICNLLTDLAIVSGNASGDDPYSFGIRHLKKWRKSYNNKYQTKSRSIYNLLKDSLCEIGITIVRKAGRSTLSYFDPFNLKNELANTNFLEKMLINVAEFYSSTLIKLAKNLQKKNYIKEREDLIEKAQNDHDFLFKTEKGHVSAEFCYAKLNEGTLRSAAFEDVLRYKVYVTGHSLGGAIAVLSGLSFDFPVLTINAVGSKDIYEIIFKKKAPTSAPRVLNIMRDFDLVATFGSHIGPCRRYKDYAVNTGILQFLLDNHGLKTFLTDIEKGMTPLQGRSTVPFFHAKSGWSQKKNWDGGKESLAAGKISLLLSEEYLESASFFYEKSIDCDSPHRERKASQDASLELYRKAAEQGSPDAQYKLGLLYLFGQHVTEDRKVALEWIRKAAERFDPLAQCHLSLLLHESTNPDDLIEADEWAMKGKLGCKRLAELENPAALFCLGAMTLKGIGFHQDEERGVSCLNRAKELGSVAAYRLLGYSTPQGISGTLRRNSERSSRRRATYSSLTNELPQLAASLSEDTPYEENFYNEKEPESQDTNHFRRQILRPSPSTLSNRLTITSSSQNYEEAKPEERPLPAIPQKRAPQRSLPPIPPRKGTGLENPHSSPQECPFRRN